MGVDDVRPVHRDPELPEAAFPAVHVEGLIRGELRRHPGGDEGLAGSDGAVMDVDAAHPSLPA